MAKYANLYRRKSGYYYCVMWIPKKLQPVFGKKQIWKSLKTSDYREALKLVSIERFKFNINFLSKLNRISHNNSMSDDKNKIEKDELEEELEISSELVKRYKKSINYYSDDYNEDLVSYEISSYSEAKKHALMWLYSEIERDTSYRNNGCEFGLLEGTAKRDCIKKIKAHISDLKKQYFEDNFSIADADLEAYIEDNLSINIFNRSNDMRLLGKAFMVARIQLFEFCLERIKGGWPRTPDELLREVIQEEKPKYISLPVSEQQNTHTDLDVITLSELVQKYKDCPSRQGLAEKSKQSYNAKYRVILEYFGEEIDISSITKSKCREFISFMMQYPTNAHTRFPNDTIFEIAVKAKKQGMTPIALKTAK